MGRKPVEDLDQLRLVVEVVLEPENGFIFDRLQARVAFAEGSEGGAGAVAQPASAIKAAVLRAARRARE